MTFTKKSPPRGFRSHKVSANFDLHIPTCYEGEINRRLFAYIYFLPLKFERNTAIRDIGNHVTYCLGMSKSYAFGTVSIIYKGMESVGWAISSAQDFLSLETIC